MSGVLASTSICFDLSVFELFLPLGCGGQVILAQNALELPTLTSAAQVSLVNTVPSAAAELIRSGGIPVSVKTVNLAGEALTRGIVEQLYGLEGIDQVYNLYGPSESTTYSTYALMKRGEAGAPTIGRPIIGTQLYVLDRRGEPAPVGVAGELYIGGEGLARGYLQRPELSAEKFVANPFSSDPGARMYRTGDLVRYLADGQLEFLGRINQQVKIRGFRIELGEIEAALTTHASIRECVVVARDGGGDKRLVAYIVSEREGRVASNGELREHLRQSLPEYMIPSALVTLSAMPLTPNGKINRRALPAPEENKSAAGEGLKARTPVEEMVAGIWSEALGIERVGVEDNFFELGGHSLLATRIISRIRDAFDVELPLRAMFESPTVEGLAANLEAALRSETAGANAPPLRVAGRDRLLPLSFAQERLWFLHQLEPQSAFYNVPVAVRLRGQLDRRALARTFTEIIRRHEVLRTVFTQADGQPVQVIHDPALSMCL